MAPRRKEQLNKRLEQGFQALKSLSVQFVSYMIEEGFKGQTLDKIITAFTRHQAKIVSGILGSAGLAGGAWAAISLWTSSLGLWGGLGYTLGLISMPVWVPVAGGVAGLTAAGGAVYGVLSLARSRSKVRKLQSIIGFSKVLIDRDEFAAADERLMRRFLQAQKVKEAQIQELLKTTPAAAQELALNSLSEQERLEVARYIFPIVYSGDGVISAAERRRFARVCAQLQLESDAASKISRNYRQRLDRQWAYLQSLICHLNYFADALVFDHQEMELLREQLEQLMHFDPRKAAPQKRDRTLRGLGRTEDAPSTPLSEKDVLEEAAAMGAYALAQTAVLEPERRSQLEAAFDDLIDSQAGISEACKKTIKQSRKKVDKLYDATRAQILAATKKAGKKEQ